MVSGGALTPENHAFGDKIHQFLYKNAVENSGSGLRLRTQVEDSGCGLWLRSQVEDSGSGLRLRSQAGLRFHNKNALVLANRCVQNYTDGPPSPHKLVRRYTGLPAQYTGRVHKMKRDRGKKSETP